MAAPFPTTYYVGIGTAISNLGVPTELSGGSYARQACSFTGTALSGLSQSFSAWVVATAPTPAVPSTYGLLYDALVGGNLIAYWNWTPGASGYTGSLTAFPATVVNITFNTYITTALNLALQGGQATSGSMIDSGAQLGTVNGNPMLAGSRLSVAPGGQLVAHIGAGQWIGSAEVQNSLFVNNLVGGVSVVTALSGGGSSASTPVIQSVVTRVAVCAASGDSVILPPLSLAPVGTMLVIHNTGASICGVYPDASTSAINAISAGTTLGLAVGKPCLFSRTGPSNWSALISS